MGLLTIANILDAIRQLMTPPEPQKRSIGVVIPAEKQRLKTTTPAQSGR